MANRADFIQLEAGDDIASVRDRLSFLRGKRVLLIWPEEGTCLTRKLDLVLIQREAMRRAVRLGLVTHDTLVIDHARELNISTFETIGASERGRWKRGRSKVFANRFQRPKDDPVPDDLKEAASRILADDIPGERRWRLIRQLVGLFAFLVVAGGLSYALLPNATVQLTPAQRSVEVLADVVVDPQIVGIDIENRIMPPVRLSVQIEESGTVETTGLADLTETTAAGSVVFINRTDAPVSIPAGTIVTTSAGQAIQFRTTQAVELAAGVGLQAEVAIEALQPSAGAAGNVESGTINTVVGPLADQVTVRNVAPTDGGSSRQQRVVAAQDRDMLLFTVRQQLQTRAYIEMESRLTPSQCILLDSVIVADQRSDWMTFSAETGQATDTLSMTMRSVVDAMAIDEQFAQQIVFAQLAAQVGPEETIDSGSVIYELGCDSAQTYNPVTGQATFQMRGSARIVSQIEPDVVRSRLTSMTLQDAAAYLVTELPLQPGAPPQITLWPEWLGSLPILPFRIDVIVMGAS